MGCLPLCGGRMWTKLMVVLLCVIHIEEDFELMVVLLEVTEVRSLSKGLNLPEQLQFQIQEEPAFRLLRR